MKKILLLCTFAVLILLGCQQMEQVENLDQPPKSNGLGIQSEMIEGDFIYRLMTEKDHYDKGENVKLYAELEYIGEEDEVEILHGGSPFLFPMSETTRKYEVDYAVTLQGLRTVLKKGEPIRQESSGGGGYSEQDQEAYKEFMKKVMDQNYPSGHYVVNGYTNFTLADGDEKNYTIEAQVEFYVDNDVKS